MSGVRDLVMEQLALAAWCRSAEPIDDDDIGIESHDGDRLVVSVEVV